MKLKEEQVELGITIKIVLGIASLLVVLSILFSMKEKSTRLEMMMARCASYDTAFGTISCERMVHPYRLNDDGNISLYRRGPNVYGRTIYYFKNDILGFIEELPFALHEPILSSHEALRRPFSLNFLSQAYPVAYVASYHRFSSMLRSPAYNPQLFSNVPVYSVRRQALTLVEPSVSLFSRIDSSSSDLLSLFVQPAHAEVFENVHIFKETESLAKNKQPVDIINIAVSDAVKSLEHVVSVIAVAISNATYLMTGVVTGVNEFKQGVAIPKETVESNKTVPLIGNTHTSDQSPAVDPTNVKNDKQEDIIGDQPWQESEWINK